MYHYLIKEFLKKNINSYQTSYNYLCHKIYDKFAKKRDGGTTTTMRMRRMRKRDDTAMRRGDDIW